MTATTVNGRTVETPELDKRKAIIDSGKAWMAQEFLDWLKGQGVVFARIGEPYEVVLCRRIYRRSGEPDPHFEPQWRGYPYESDLLGYPYAACNLDGTLRDESEPIVEVRENGDRLGFHALYGKPGEEVLAEFFGIDLTKIDAEQRALLDALRA